MAPVVQFLDPKWHLVCAKRRLMHPQFRMTRKANVHDERNGGSGHALVTLPAIHSFLQTVTLL